MSNIYNFRRMAGVWAAILFAIAALATICHANGPKPNVLFIAVDDMQNSLGCYGDSFAKTPQIDGLASQGMTFLNHHCPWPVCGPSRAALVCSLMPEETNVLGFRKIRDKNFLPNIVTLPQHFRNNGYETACTGKFHDPRTVGTPVPVSSTYPDGVMDDGRTVDDPASWSVPYVAAGAGYSPPTKVAVDSTNQADSLYDDDKIRTAGINLIDDLVTAGGTAPGNKPFFLAIGFKKPHLPFVAPANYWNLYDRNAAPLAAYTSLPAGITTYGNNTLTDNSEILGGGDDTTNGYEPYKTNPALLLDAAQQRELLHGYYACVSFIDKLVGDIRTKLANTNDPLQPGKKLSETTIVIFWSDHGFHLGDHGKWAKHTIMEKATGSPFILFDPRNPRNATNNKTTKPVGSMDIYPTLCELAGLAIPEQPATTASFTGRPLRGRSLLPLLNNPASAPHHGVVTQFNNSGQYGYAYRTERFRYIEWISATGNMEDGNARRELYDYTADPQETRNLAADPAYAAIVWQLSRAMRAETTVRGTGRLNVASPIAAGSNAHLPDIAFGPAAAGSLTLTWPGSGAVSYNVLGSNTLAAGSWVNDFSNLPGPAFSFPVTDSRRFYRIGFGANTPPRFLSDPITRPWAVAGVSYTTSLAASVTDPNAGDTLTFSKISGPAWLSIATNGTLSGMPAATDAGAGYFIAQVTDASGCFARATLQISVVDPAANQAPAFISDPITKPNALAGAAYSGSLAGDAADPDPGQPLTFSKVSGPAWLVVAADGALSGTPGTGDTGAVSATVRVMDPAGAFGDAVLNFTVSGPAAGIQLVSKSNATAGTGLAYGAVFFTGVTVEAGDMVVVAHANNKNLGATANGGNTISLAGLSPNAVTSVNSGSTGAASSTWVFYSSITTADTYSLTLNTSNTLAASVTQTTTLFILRPMGGSLAVAATDGSAAASTPGVTSLSLDFTTSPAVSEAFGIAAVAQAASTFSSNPSGWTQELNGADKRRTLFNSAISGASHTATFGAPAATDMALAGIIVKVVP